MPKGKKNKKKAEKKLKLEKVAEPSLPEDEAGQPAPEKKVKAEKKPKREKAEKQPKPEKTGRHAGKGRIHSVEVVQVLPDEPAACSFDPRTGLLVLQVPRARDGAEGPRGPKGAPGAAGEPGVGLDYAQAPGGKEDYGLFVDDSGCLCYRAGGEVAVVNLTFSKAPAPAAE